MSEVVTPVDRQAVAKLQRVAGEAYIKYPSPVLIKARATGLYPLAMSTSIGSWPGAMSNGDKTVFDAWGKDLSFSKVKFWRLDTGASK